MTVQPDTFNRLPAGATVILTDAHKEVLDFGRRILRFGGRLQVWGAWGTGKTVALLALAAAADLRVIYICLADQAKGHELIRTLHRQLLGEDTDLRGMPLLEKLHKHLRDERLLIIIDEAYLLNRSALRHVRWLHDHRVGWGLVLGGIDPETLARLTPENESRACLRVRFEPLGTDFLETVRAYHPLFRATDEGVLRSINAEYAKGVFRRWENVLEVGRTFIDDAGADRFSAELAGATLHALIAGEE